MNKWILAFAAIISLSACGSEEKTEAHFIPVKDTSNCRLCETYTIAGSIAIATRDTPPVSFASTMSFEDRRTAINAWYDQERASAIRQMQERLAELEQKRRAAIEYESKN